MLKCPFVLRKIRHVYARKREVSKASQLPLFHMKMANQLAECCLVLNNLICKLV